MDENNFKIALGAELKPDVSSDINSQIKNLKINPVKLNIDTDNAKKKLKTIKNQIESLNDIQVALNTGTVGSKSGNKNLLPISPIDVSKLTQSLDKLDASLDGIQKSLGSLDDASGMQSILETINQVNASLSEMGKQFKSVEQMFNGASFNLNFNLGLGGNNNPIARNAEYGKAARKTISQLREQYSELENIFYEYGKSNDLLAGNDKSGFLTKSLFKFGGKIGQGGNILDLFGRTNGGSMKSQIEAYQELINFAKQAAKANNIDLSAFDSKFGNSADKLVENIEKIQSGEQEVEDSLERLKNIFGGSSNIEVTGFAEQLTSVIEKLEQIDKTIKEVSNNISFDGLTESFKQLSSSIQQIVDNCTIVRNSIATGFDGAETVAQNASNSFSSVATSAKNAASEINGITLNQTARQIGNMKTAMSSFGFDESSIAVATKDIESMNLAISKITTKMQKDGSVRLTVVGTDELGRTVTAVRSVHQEIKELEDGTKQVRTVVGDLGKTISQSFGEQPKEVTDAYKELLSIIKQMGALNIEIDGLDADKNASEIEELTRQLLNLNDRYDQIMNKFGQGFDDTQIQDIEKAWNDVSDSIALADAQMSDASKTQQVTDAYQELLSIIKQITKLSEKKESLDFGNASEFGELSLQLRELKNRYEEIKKAHNDAFNEIQRNRLEAQETAGANRIALAEARFNDKKREYTGRIEFDLNANEFDKQINALESKFGRLSNKTTEVKEGINSVKLALEEMNDAVSSGDMDKLILAHERYQKALDTTSNQIDILAKKEKDSIDVNKLSQNRDVLSSSMSVWLQKNSAAASQFGGRIRALQKELKDCNNVRFNEIKKEFEKIKNEAILAGKNVKTFGDRLKESFTRLTTYFSAYEMISMASQAIRSMYDDVVEVDTAMTNLYKVTDKTAGRYEQFLTSASKNSQELGRSLSGFIDQTANWAKMGFDLDEAEELAKLSSIYANVADLDDATAVSDLVTVMKAYGIEASNAITIVDSLNKISNEFAVTASGLGEGLTKAAASMATSGVSFEKTIAMLTGISEITQSPEEAGNFLKVAVMRIQGMKGELEELGEEVDDSVDSISKVQTQILNLTHGKVNIFDDNGEFRDYFEILDDIAGVVDDLASTDRASLYEILFGKQRANQGAALIKAFQSGQVDKAYKAALDSEGSAYAEQAKWADSLKAKLGTLQAAWQSLSKSVLDSDFLKWLIDTGTDLTNVLDDIINKAGVLPTLLTTLSGGMSLFKNKGILSTDKNHIKFFDIDMSALIGDYSELSEAIEQYNSMSGKSIQTQQIYQKYLNSSTDSINKYLSGLNGAKASMGGYIKSLIGAKAGTIGLQVATAALNAAITMGLSFAIQAVVSGLDNLIHYAERASEAADELKEKNMEEAKAAQEEVEKLDELIAKYKELAESENQDSSTRNEIKEIQSDIVDLVGAQARNIDLVNGKLDEQYEKLLAIREEEAKKAVQSSVSGYSSAIDSANKAQGSQSGTIAHPTIGGGYEYVGARDKDAERILKEAGVVNGFEMSTGGYLDNTLYISVVPFVELGDDSLTNAEIHVQRLNEMIKALENAEDYDYSSSNVYKTLVSERDRYQTYIDDVSSAAQTLLDSTIIASTYNDTLTNMTVDSAESFGEYRDVLIDMVKNSPDLSAAIANGDITDSDIENSVTSYLATLEHLSDEYNAWYNKIGSDTAKNIQSIKDAYADSGRIQALDPDTAAKQIEEFNAWIDGLSQKDREIICNISINNSDEAREEMLAELERLSNGGNVDLTVRPVIDAQALVNAGWEGAGEGAATVFTTTFSNEAAELGEKDGIAINFTPIMVDENGNVTDILSPDELSAYASEVISGVREDDLNLQIGAIYEGSDAIAQAEKDAVKIHRLHDQYLLTSPIDEWELPDWQNALENYQVPEAQKITFSDLIADEDFMEKIDEYMEKAASLKDAYQAILDGDFTDEDFIELVKLFPELASRTDDLDVAIVELLGDMDSDIVDHFNSQFGYMDTEEDVDALTNLKDAVLGLGQIVGNTQYAIDFSVESKGMDSFVDAVKESVSATGLATDSIEALHNRYKDIDGYDPAKLFERTANGIHLNTKALRGLESAYVKQQKAKIDKKLEKLYKEYNRLTDEINTTSDAAKRAELYAQRNDIRDQIADTANLAAQYDGLTSAFYKWQIAQSSGEEGDLYDSVTGSLEGIKELYDKGLIGTNEFRAAVQLMTDVDLSNASPKELVAAYEAGYPKMTRYFQDSHDGVLNFLHDIQAMNSEWAHLNEDGSWTINFSGDNDEEIAKALGVNVETVQAIMRKLSDYGFDINLESAYTNFEQLATKAEEANAKLLEMGLTTVEFDFDTTDLDSVNSQIEQAQNLLDTFKNEDGTFNIEAKGYEEAKLILDTLLATKQQLESPSDDDIPNTSVKVDSSELTYAIGLVDQLKTAVDEYEGNLEVGADTREAAKKILSILLEINKLSPEVKATLGLDDKEFNYAVETLTRDPLSVVAEIDPNSVDEVNRKIQEIKDKPVNVDVDDSELTDAIGLVDELEDAIAEYNQANEMGLETTAAEAKLKRVLSQIKNLPPEVKSKLGFDTKEFDDAIKKIVGTPIGTTIEDEDYKSSLDIIVDTINDAKPVLNVDTNDLNEAITAVGDLESTVADYNEKGSTVKVKTDEAKGEVNSLSSDINNLSSNRVSLKLDPIALGVINSKINEIKGNPINVNGDVDVEYKDLTDAIFLVGNLKEAIAEYNQANEMGLNTDESEQKIQNLLIEIEKLPPEVKTILGLNSDPFNKAVETLLTDLNNPVGTATVSGELDPDSLTIITDTINGIAPEVTVGVNPDKVNEFKEEDHDTTGDVNWENSTKDVDSWAKDVKESLGLVHWKNDTSEVKTHFDATGTVHWTNSGDAGVNGTATPPRKGGGSGRSGGNYGSAYGGSSASTDIYNDNSPFFNRYGFVNGTAYAKGNWGTQGSGTALVGELGQELVVRDGRFFTIGDNGAELFKYKKDDIIFNAEQTRQIFENGKITSGLKRGSSFVNGNAFVEGTAFKAGNNDHLPTYWDWGSSGFGTIIVGGSVTTTPGGNNSGNSDGSDKDKDKFKETFDWIEVAIDRIERAISRLGLKVNSIYKTWSSRNKNLKKEISKIGEEIDLQRRGYQRYLEQANSVGLDESYAELVRNGEIDIEDITDEELANKIKEYQEW